MTTTNLSIGPFEVHVPDEDWLTSDGASRGSRAGPGLRPGPRQYPLGTIR
jgi:hypothetical protein